MTWVLLLLCFPLPAVMLNGHFNGDDGDRFSLKAARVVFSFMMLAACVLVVLVVLGRPAPGDMRDLDDGVASRLLFVVVCGSAVAFPALWVPRFGELFGRDRHRRSSGDGPIVPRLQVFSKVRQSVFALLVVVSSVRGFERTALGSEYHWWLLVLAWAEGWILLGSAKKPDGRIGSEAKIAASISMFAVLMFLVQPLRFDPSWLQ